VTRRRTCSKGCWVKRMTWIISSMVNSCAVAEAHLILQVAYDMAVPRPVVLWMVSVWYHFCHRAFRELVCRFKFFKLHFAFVCHHSSIMLTVYYFSAVATRDSPLPGRKLTRLSKPGSPSGASTGSNTSSSSSNKTVCCTRGTAR
jgi:hypothetical protein